MREIILRWSWRSTGFSAAVRSSVPLGPCGVLALSLLLQHTPLLPAAWPSATLFSSSTQASLGILELFSSATRYISEGVTAKSLHCFLGLVSQYLEIGCSCCCKRQCVNCAPPCHKRSSRPANSSGFADSLSAEGCPWGLQKLLSYFTPSADQHVCFHRGESQICALTCSTISYRGGWERIVRSMSQSGLLDFSIDALPRYLQPYSKIKGFMELVCGFWPQGTNGISWCLYHLGSIPAASVHLSN